MLWTMKMTRLLTCENNRAIDSAGTLTNATRARQHAQALGGVLMAVLCNCLAISPAAAGDGLSIKTLALRYLHNADEYQCFNKIVIRESHWDIHAVNHRSTAYGIGQLLNEKSNDGFEQIIHAVAYGRYRYKTLCNAWIFHRQHGYW
jgi:hypothetical protein